MKNFYYSLIMFVGLISWINLPQAFAQYNTIYGTGAGTGGYFNTHIGINVGAVSTAYNNTFVGYYSGNHTTTGGGNTFVGTGSGQFNTTGYINTFIGHDVGNSNISGEGNVFLGSYTGNSNTTGRYNTFLGEESGYSNTTGNYNTYVGQYSGYYNTTGKNNTYLGRTSGYNNTTGSNNVYIGYLAGYSESGSNKLLIDNNNDSKPLLYGNFASNVISIGYKYTGTTYKLYVPGKVRATAYDVASDKRLKQDIHPLENALTKVQKVDGVSYLLKDNAFTQQGPKEEEQSALTNLNVQPDEQPATKTDKTVYYGFVAQDIQKVFPDLVTEDEGMLSVNYMGMIPVLVEAIKELSAERDILKQELNSMKQVLIEKGLLPVSTAPSSVMGSLLQQNQPNPFNQSTSISYQVPNNAGQVSMVITNLNGVEIKRFDNLQTGAGQVEISAGSFAAGTYIYTLLVDGRKLSAQRMILTR